MTELSPKDIASKTAGYWAILNKIRLQAGTFSFKDHEYQVEPMCGVVDGDKVIIPRRKCVRKAAQGGFTEIEVIDSLHGMRYKLLPQGVLYLFPTSDDVNEFSKSRFNPLIASNREAIGKFVKSGGKGTDTASLKKIHNSFLYLRGARLSQKISDMNESSKLKSIPVDRVVFDEIDHMDEEVIGKARGRMGHSKIKQERFLSNPLVPGEGIDKIFHTSDQRYWFRKCATCGEWTCAELFFDEDPERAVGVRADGTGYIACKKCGRELPIDRLDAGKYTSEWVPSVKENSDFMHGYHWSQLTSACNDPLEILHDFRNPPENNIADVYRLKLGLPYIAAEDRLVRSQVLECCGVNPMSYSHEGPCAAGVDVGKIKHVIIGTKVGNKQYELVKMLRLAKWDRILDTLRRFHVKIAVVDIRPYEDSAREFQEKARKIGIQVYLCEYKENAVADYKYNDTTGIVSANRTQIFDSTHRMTMERKMTIPRYDEEVGEFAKQMCGAYKVLETNKKTGTSIYRYKGSEEHYRNALNYFKLAARGHRLRVLRVGGVSPAGTVISNYKRI